jgi:hypothetical protein
MIVVVSHEATDDVKRILDKLRDQPQRPDLVEPEVVEG